MDTINRIKGNVMAFLDQLIEPVYKRYYPDDAIPELSDSIINGSDIKVEEYDISLEDKLSQNQKSQGSFLMSIGVVPTS